MNTVTTATPATAVAATTDAGGDKSSSSVNRALGQLSAHLKDGVTPTSLVVSALAAGLSGFGSSGVVALQASVVIAFVVLVGVQLAWSLLRNWSPRRLDVSATDDAHAIHALAPYQSARRPGAASVAAAQPERSGEVSAVVDNVTGDSNVGIVYGDPGNGKTSLVHGAVMPALESSGWRVWYVGALDRRPVGAVIQAGVSAGTPRAAGADEWSVLTAMLQAAQTPTPGVVLLLDHVERLLQQGLNDAEQTQFWTQLGQVASASVRVLLIGRTEALPLAISAAKIVDPTLETLDDVPQHELTAFTCEQALDALLKIASASGLALEERLARGIVHDLAIENQVSPAELQLVLDTLFRTGVVTLPDYRRRGGAVGAMRHYFARQWWERIRDQGGPVDAEAAVLARLASAEPPRGHGTQRAGLSLEQLATTDQAIAGLVSEHLIERTRGGTYRLAEPGLARPLQMAFGSPERGIGRWRGAVLPGLSAAAAWSGHGPRMAFAAVVAAMVATVGLVVYLIVAGYPQGRLLASLPVVVSRGAPALDLVAFEPGGRFLAADVGSEIIVWDLHNQNTVFQRLSKAPIDKSFVTNYLAFVGSDEVRLYGVRGEVWAWQLSNGAFIRQDEKPIPASSASRCSVSAATVNRTGRLLAEGTSCGEVRVMDVDAGVEVRAFDHGDPKCRSVRMAFSRAENQLLEFYRCKGANDVVQLTPWPLGQAQPGADLTPDIKGELVKVVYLPDGNPYVVTVTQADTHLWEMARSLARSRWPLAVYDGAPTDLAPDGRVLAVGFASEVRLYERAEWPFEFIPVKDSAKGLLGGAAVSPDAQ